MNATTFFPRVAVLTIGLALVASSWLGRVVPSDPGSSAPPLRLAAQAGPTCHDVLVVGVDRSGRGWSDGGLGPALRPAANTVAKRTAGSSVGVRHLGVRFVKTTRLVAKRDLQRRAKAAITQPRARKWAMGLGLTVRKVSDELQRQIGACPEQTYVLAGQAQGASVVHRLLLRLESNATVRSRLVGAVLVSDGDRSPRSRATLLGSPAAGAGGKGVLTRFLKRQPDVPPRGLDVPVVSICNKGDIVCDTRGWSAKRSLAASRAYTTRAARARARQAGAVLAERAGAWPRAIAGQSTLVRPATAFAYRVGVRVGPAYAADTVFEDIAGLPSGVTLSPDGLLSGTVATTGSWTVTFRVRNARLGTVSSAGAVTINSTEVTAGSAISAAGQTTCQVRSDATAWCAGENAWGQLGIGNRTDSTRLVQVGGPEWASISTSGATTCGIKLTTQLFCWGMNTRGQLGIGAEPQHWTPQRVSGSGWTQVSTGWLHTCGIKDSGTIFCWGNNDFGQLGTDNRVLRRTPAKVVTGSDWASVTVGGWHTCATTNAGAAYCWGRNDFGQLGTGNSSVYLKPARVDTSLSYSSLDASWSSTCGLAGNAKIMCWGQNDQGQLGDGSRTPRSRPVAVAGNQQWDTVAVGDGHGCGLDTQGSAWCWGSNRYGQLGDGSDNNTVAPKRVIDDRTYVGLDAGWMHTCALSLDEKPLCWGNNEQGQLARGDRSDRATPPGVRAIAPREAARRLDQNVVITSFNVLGSNHTQPGGGALNYAPARIRGEWTTNLLQGYGADIIGFQEIRADQYNVLRQSFGSSYAFYPPSPSAGKVLWQSVMWDTTQWEFVRAVNVYIPFAGTTRPNPMVQLRSKLSGKRIWVFNVHNSAKRTPERQRERNAAVKKEIAKIKAQRRKNFPVVFLGDMNERKTVFCKVTRQTDLRSVSGGSTGKTCRPPSRMHLDWIFVSPEFAVRNFAFDRSPAVARITDHSVLTSKTSIPGA